MRFTNHFHAALLICVILSFASYSYGAATVSIISSGDASYVIQGAGMDGVAGIQLDIAYDSASLSSPSVTMGGLVAGATPASNTTIPGLIKIAIIRTTPFSGSGQIASINFASRTGSGGITSVTSKMINSHGTTLASQAVVTGISSSAGGLSSTPGVPFQAPQTPSQQTTPTPAQTATASITSTLGTVTMPSDVPARSETKPADTRPAEATVPVAPPAEPSNTRSAELPSEAKPVSEAEKQVKIKTVSHIGALENFRLHTGEKTPVILIELLNKNIAPNISQEPALVLSDGKTPIKIMIKIAVDSDKSPNFALNGAKLLSLNKDNASGWIIEALPQAGILRANLTILTDNETIEFPLTLAPPLDGLLSAEAAFAAFLKDSGNKTPRHDLNGDGKHDYLDDFIYTANFLFKKGAAGKTKKKQ